MVIEREGGTTEAAKDIEVGRFRGQRERSRGQRGFAIETGAAHVRAEQEMGDGFQENEFNGKWSLRSYLALLTSSNTV